jgi:hypothetical protein
MLDADFVNAIVEIAKQANGVQGKITTIKELPHNYIRIGSDGEAEVVPLQHNESSRANSIASLMEWTKQYSDPEVWYSRNAVFAIGGMFPGLKPDTCTFHMPFSKQFTRLVEIDKRPDGLTLTQPELWHLLRTVFPNCFPSHPNLAAKIGRVDIKKAAESTAVVKRDGVSMSRSMIAEASGANELPEVLEFDVPIYEIAAIPVMARVECAFALDAAAERFAIHVLPGEIERACATGEAAAFNQIKASMAADDDFQGAVNVYNGVMMLS